jgi:hypothetical protein
MKICFDMSQKCAAKAGYAYLKQHLVNALPVLEPCRNVSSLVEASSMEALLYKTVCMKDIQCKCGLPRHQMQFLSL